MSKECIWEALEKELTQEELLHALLEEAEVVVPGIGAGMSAATGFTYVGSRFEEAFPDFIQKYNYFDMLQAFVSDFEDWEEYWAFQSRFTLMNYFDQPVGKSYVDLKKILKNKEYHIITTNADNSFYAAAYDRERVFYIQGEYGLWQCSNFCQQKTYQDELLTRKMAAEQKNMKVPSDLIPHCPNCGAPLEINKRDAEKGMVEDAYWHEQEAAYHAFLKKHEGKKILFLEIGVGHTTPQFIREPFQEMTANNPKALYVRMNQKLYAIPEKIRAQTIRITDDIFELLGAIAEY